MDSAPARGEAAEVGDPKAWLTAQLDGRPPLLEDASLPSPESPADAVRGLREAQATRDPEKIRQARVAIRAVATTETHATLSERVRTEPPFVERLVAFWSPTTFACPRSGRRRWLRSSARTSAR